MAFATFLALCLFFAGSALAMVLGDNQFAARFHWAIPWLWGLALLSLSCALASAQWFRNLFLSEKLKQKASEKQPYGDGSPAIDTTHGETVNYGLSDRPRETISQAIRDSNISGDVRMIGKVEGDYVDKQEVHHHSSYLHHETVRMPIPHFNNGQIFINVCKGYVSRFLVDVQSPFPASTTIRLRIYGANGNMSISAMGAGLYEDTSDTDSLHWGPHEVIDLVVAVNTGEQEYRSRPYRIVP